MEKPGNFRSLSVLIPFKNEEKNLPVLLKALSEQTLNDNYYEIIFIDDFSTDNSTAVVENFILNKNNIFLLKNKGIGKKSALITGIDFSKNDMIVTTDADCIPGTDWLKTISLHSQEADMLLMPVFLSENNKNFNKKGFFQVLFQKMQQLEFISLQASGAGAAGCGCPIMANAANMAFNKKFFREGDDVFKKKYKSGDDIFLLHFIKAQKGKIKFLNNSKTVIRTSACNNLHDFFRQRIRWASKSKGYKDFFTIFTALIVWLMNIFLLFSMIYGVIFSVTKYFLILFIIKSIPDFLLLYFFADYYGQKKLLKFFLPLQFIYPLYIVYVSIASFFVSPEWKK